MVNIYTILFAIQNQTQQNTSAKSRYKQMFSVLKKLMKYIAKAYQFLHDAHVSGTSDVFGGVLLHIECALSILLFFLISQARYSAGNTAWAKINSAGTKHKQQNIPTLPHVLC